MTALLLYNAVLVEVNKVDAPNILLEDFNYLANKAINNYINKRYNIYDVNQQTTDDLRVLKASAILPVIRETKYDELGFMDATYEVILPSDYLHMLNCECIYKVNKTYKCYTPNKPARAKATRLTADLYSLVLDNFWNRPTYKKPYYYIHNINTSEIVPTDPIRRSDHNNINVGTDFVYASTNTSYSIPSSIKFENEIYDRTRNKDGVNQGMSLYGYTTSNQVVDTPTIWINDSSSDIYTAYDRNGSYTSNLSNATEIEVVGTRSLEETDAFGNNIITIPKNKGVPTGKTIKLSEDQSVVGSLVERAAQVRYGNASEVRMEIRYGTDYQSVFELLKVLIDYIKTPQLILLTQEQLDRVEDTSQMLEFPDYVCQEIVNELVHIVMELISDPRLQTHPVVNLSIANPVQQLTTQPAATTA